MYFQCWVKREIEIDIEAGEKYNHSADKENGLSSQDFDQRQQTEWTIKQEQGNDYEDSTSNEVPLILFVLKEIKCPEYTTTKHGHYLNFVLFLVKYYQFCLCILYTNLVTNGQNL